MNRLIQSIIFVVVLFANCYGQDGVIQTQEELKDAAYEKMFLFFQKMEDLHQQFVAAARVNSWSAGNESNKLAELDTVMLFYACKEDRIQYLARGISVTGSGLPTAWAEEIRNNDVVHRRSGPRLANVEKYPPILVDQKKKDDLANPTRKSAIFDPMVIPIVNVTYINAGRAKIEHLSTIFLEKYELYKAERLKSGNLRAYFGGRSSLTFVYIIEFGADSDFMPIHHSVRYKLDKNSEFGDVVKHGWLNTTTATSWSKVGNRFVPKIVDIACYGTSKNTGTLYESHYEFVWKIGKRFAKEKFALDSDDWMEPFFDTVIDENYNLLTTD